VVTTAAREVAQNGRLLARPLTGKAKELPTFEALFPWPTRPLIGEEVNRVAYEWSRSAINPEEELPRCNVESPKTALPSWPAEELRWTARSSLCAW
jgi:hypothetical protein